MKEKLSQYLGIDKEVITKLMMIGLIDPRTANAFIIYNEYKEERAKDDKVSDRYIHTELAIKHNVSPSAIYKWCQMFN